MRLPTWLHFRPRRADAMACREAVALLSAYSTTRRTPTSDRSCATTSETAPNVRSTSSRSEPTSASPATRSPTASILKHVPS